jgi:hypothetical protein
VCDVNEVVRVERDVNVVEFVFETSDHLCEAFHVVVGAWHVQRTAFRIAEIDLRVDN